MNILLLLAEYSADLYHDLSRPGFVTNRAIIAFVLSSTALTSGGWGADLVSRMGYPGRRKTFRAQMTETFHSRREAIRVAGEQARHLATLRYRYSVPLSR
ncbi:hypothetical protein ACU60U_20485 [Klebsiella aerogenes]